MHVHKKTAGCCIFAFGSFFVLRIAWRIATLRIMYPKCLSSLLSLLCCVCSSSLSWNTLRSVCNHIAIMLDTKGPEIRSGFFANNAKKIDLVKGETIVLTTDYHFKGDAKKLACSYAALATSVKPGQRILVADGSLVLTVLSIDATVGEVSCRIENHASIGERKNMNLPGVVVELPTFTEKDVDDIVNFGKDTVVRVCCACVVRDAPLGRCRVVCLSAPL